MIKEHKINFTLSAFIKKNDKDVLEFIGYNVKYPSVIIRKEVKKEK